MTTQTFVPRLRRRGSAALLVLLLGFAAPDTPIADAAMQGDAARVRALLAEGQDVNAAQGDGMTALHWASMNGALDLAQLLVGAGAYVNSGTRIGQITPLHLASRGGHGAVVAALLEAGADPARVTTNGGATPLHYAAESGDVAAITALVRHHANVNAAEPNWGATPLMYAAAKNRPEAIRALLAAGADPSVRGKAMDMVARDAADGAAMAERDRRVQASVSGLSTIQRPSAPEPAAAEAAKDKPLSYADYIGKYGGLGPLHLAAREGNTDAVLALLEGGAVLDQPSAGDQSTALLIATINGYYDLAAVLVARGANPNLASEAAVTPLYAAINAEWIPKSRHPQPAEYLQQKTTYLQLMEALLKAGADPNVRVNRNVWFMQYARSELSVDVGGSTAFWRAAYAQDVSAMRILVQYQADPDIPSLNPVPGGYASRLVSAPDGDDPSGLPPVPPLGPGIYPLLAAAGVGYGQGSAGYVHRGVPNGWLDAVTYLVGELGADVNARDQDGYTAMHHAAARGDNAVIKFLLERGADPFAIARSGQTTVDMANGPVQRIQPFPETIALLEALGVKNNNRCVSC